MTMIEIDRLTISVTVEGDAESGERAFARLFDKYSQLRDLRSTSAVERSANLERDRALSATGGRR